MPQFRFNTISRTDIESSPGGAQMIYAIDYDGPNHLLVTGCPGSGKTTVSIMRAERLSNLGKKILVITYQDLLRKSLVNIATPELAPHIVKFYKWFSNKFQYLERNMDEHTMLEMMKGWNGIDEIIIDEGQDFEARIFRSLLEKCKKLTVGADNAQRVHTRGLKAEQISIEIKKKGALLPIGLQYNYRNTFEIYNFARHFLPDSERANNNLAIDRIPKGKGDIPVVFVVPDHDTRLAQLKILLSDAGDRNIAVLVYEKEEVEAYYTMITRMGFKCSMHHSDNHIWDEMENIIVTTFKSAKGLEFQVVIMPDMETAGSYPYKTREHYYIAGTRAKENLFLIAQGSLPYHFNRFDSSSYELKKQEAMKAPEFTNASPLPDDLPF